MSEADTVVASAALDVAEGDAEGDATAGWFSG